MFTIVRVRQQPFIFFIFFAFSLDMNISPLSPVSLDSMVVNGDDTKEPGLTQESAAAARCTYTHTRHTCICVDYIQRSLFDERWTVLKKKITKKKPSPVALDAMTETLHRYRLCWLRLVLPGIVRLSILLTPTALCFLWKYLSHAV